ncbi:MAG: asparaginase, partial [Agathobacter sp.]|nr:asparaginase [Agathobacter sp.]
MKKILFIATGGTIASKKSDSGLKPQISPEELLSYIPTIQELCEVETLQLLSLDSSNMEPKHWRMMVECIQENYDKYDGFVIAHGTDTMAYTAAGLSYMIQNSRKPIVITGSQKPIDLDITDAKTNLLDSFTYAADAKSQGIVIVFDGKVIAGTRAKKIRSKSYNAFDSIDFPALAIIQDGQIMRYIPMEPYQEEVKFYLQMDEKVFLLKLIPGITPEILKYIFEHYDAVIVESFGVGGIPKSISEDFY